MPAAQLNVLAALLFFARTCADSGVSDPECTADGETGECAAGVAGAVLGAGGPSSSKNLVGPAAAALGARGQRAWRPASETDDTMGMYLEGADHDLPLFLNAGDIVERCLCITAKTLDIEAEHLEKMKHMFFDTGLDDDDVLFPFGWCGLYNEAAFSSSHEEGGPNLQWEREDIYGAQVITLRAMREVAAGEELTVRRAKTSFAMNWSDRDSVRRAMRLANVSVPRKSVDVTLGRSVQLPVNGDLDLRVDERGVWVHATRSYKVGDVIEVIPNMVFSTDWDPDSHLTEWSYQSHIRDDLHHLPFGYISFFRTANVSNVEYMSGVAGPGTTESMSVSTLVLATRDIEPGEELVLDAKWGHDHGDEGTPRPEHDSGRERRPSEVDGEYGVFATWAFEEGDVVDFCLGWVLSSAEAGGLLPLLYQHPASPPAESNSIFTAGWCMLYNAAFADNLAKPNVLWESAGMLDGNNKTRPAVRLLAARRIEPGEELVVARAADTPLGTRGIRERLESTLTRRPSQRLREYLRPPAQPLMPKWQAGADMEVRASPKHGVGVFALRNFSNGELMETALKLHLSPTDMPKALIDYTFQSAVDPEFQAAALGFGMLYNHEDNPNVKYYTHPDCVSMFVKKHCQVMDYYASRDIAAGEELFISYGESYWTGRPWLSP